MKKRKLLSLILALTLTLSILAGCSTPEQPNPSTPPSRIPVSESVPAKRMDDFYAAVNETVLKEHDAEKMGGSWNWFFDLEEKSYQEQKAIIQAAAAAPGQIGSSEYKLRTLYTLAMNQEKRDAESIAYFNELMKPVMEAGSIGEMMEALALLQYCYGFDALLNTEVLALDDNPGEYIAQIKDMNFGLDVRDFADEEAEAENRGYFTDYLARLLTLAGRNDGEKASGEVYDFVKAIIASRNEGEYKKISVDDLQKQLSNIDLCSRSGQGIFGKCHGVASGGIGKTVRWLWPAGRSDSLANPSTRANALLLSHGQLINIPVSVLEAPYFNPAADEAQNLGALGTIIGHEITHAFDDLGSQYVYPLGGFALLQMSW